MERWVTKGQMPDPDTDLAAEMYSMAEEILACHGYCHYEISNWAQPGYESRHNLTYWRNMSYLGVGPGAHSYLAGHRFYNLPSPEVYIQRIRRWAQRGDQDGMPVGQVLLSKPGAVEEVEPIGERLEIWETIMLGLRLEEGIDLEEFRDRFHCDMYGIYGQEIEDLVGLGLLASDSSNVRLTDRGKLLGNEVFLRFLVQDGS